MKRLILGAVVLLLSIMALSPVVTLAADPPDPNGMIVTIVAVAPNGDLTVIVNSKNLDDFVTQGQLPTGSRADLWMWDTVHALEDYAHNNNVNVKLLMDSQAKTIQTLKVQQEELVNLDGRLQSNGNIIWATKSQINQNEVSIQHQQESLNQTDALLLSVIEGSDQTAKWLEVNNEYWNNRVLTLENRINELQEQKAKEGLMVYGGYGLAVCFLAVFVVGVKKYRW